MAKYAILNYFLAIKALISILAKAQFVLYSIFLLLIAFSQTVGAVKTITQEHIKSFSLDAPEGMSLSGVEMYNLDPNSNTTVYLNAYGQTYTLNVNATKEYGFWWVFNISLINPVGNVSTARLTSSAPFATNYDLYIQYYWMTSDGSFDTIFDLDVYTGILPLNAQINDWDSDASTALQFSEVHATSTSYFDLTVFAVTDEEFAKQLANDALAALIEGVSDLFTWSWSMILNFCKSIPYIGPYIASILIISALTIDSIIFYGDLLLVEYSETTFLTIEFFILAYSFSKRGNIFTKLKRVVNCHIKIIETTISVAQAAVNLFSSIVQTISSIISSLKPV